MDSIVKKTSLGILSLFKKRFKILAYHGIPEHNPSEYEVSLKNFKQQIGILKNEGYNVLPLHKAMIEVASDSIPPNTIVITFDDGHESIWDNAVPVLLEYSFPSTVFIPTGLVGTTDHFSGFKTSLRKIADWNQISQAINQGVSIGGHSVTHRNLCTLEYPEISQEVSKSYKTLKNNLGENNYYFAYPFGLLDYNVKRVLGKSKYIGALCFGSTLSNCKYTDRFLIKREKILSNTNEKQFRQLINPRNDLVRALKAILKLY